jgi:hypothetical protein
MPGIGKYKKGAKFTLKSRNKPIFKTMGSSPIEQKESTVDVDMMFAAGEAVGRDYVGDYSKIGKEIDTAIEGGKEKDDDKIKPPVDPSTELDIDTDEPAVWEAPDLKTGTETEHENPYVKEEQNLPIIEEENEEIVVEDADTESIATYKKPSTFTMKSGNSPLFKYMGGYGKKKSTKY